MFSGLPPESVLPDLRTNSRRQLFANAVNRTSARSFAPVRGRLCQPRIPEDRKERSASAVRKRIGPALAIVDEEIP